MKRVEELVKRLRQECNQSVFNWYFLSGYYKMLEKVATRHWKWSNHQGSND